MFRKIAFAVFFLFILPTQLLAQVDTGTSIIPPYPRPDTQSFLGQQHAYTVVFRGNGEAVVSARVTLTNNSESALKEVELRLPTRAQTSELTSFQVIKEPPCVRYEQSPSGVINYQAPTCAQYGEPDYFQYWGQNKYQKADVQQSGDTLKITLPNVINPGKSGAFFVYFRALGFTSKDIFGAYKFKFETMKVNESIQNLTVGINTDSDLVLKGAQGEVNYRFDTATSGLTAMEKSTSPSASPAIDNFYQQIGYGQITKTASSLAPLESYSVDGAYAKTRLMLYGKEIAIGLGIALLLIVILFVLGRIIYKKMTKEVKSEVKQEVGVSVKPRGSFLLVTGISLGSAILAGLYTGLLLLLGQFLGSFSYAFYQYQMFFWLIIAVLSFAVYAILIFGPAILMGVKRSVGWGLATLGLTVVWLVMLAALVILILFLISKDQSSPGIYPMRGGGVDSTFEMMPDPESGLQKSE